MNTNNQLIPMDVIEKVRAKANIKDVLEYLGVECKRAGSAGDWVAYSPFRPDKHLGSFRISERKGIAKDFSTGEKWDAIDAVMDLEHKTFHEAVRLLAAKYDVYIDDAPVPKVEKLPTREKPKELPTLYRLESTIESYNGHEDINPLLCYLRSLPLNQDALTRSIRMYRVGTATNGKYRGWTIWWHLPLSGYVQTGKLMAYCADGHRDKTPDEYGREKTTWAHALWRRAGMYNPDEYQARTGIFGYHLMHEHRDARVAVVESEKTALICSTMCDPDSKVWIATGGKSGLRYIMNEAMARNRSVELYPDKDGYDEWKQQANAIAYNRIVVVTPEQQGWTEADGEKADIADIIIRVLTSKDTTPGEKAAYQLGHPEKAKDLDNLITTLNLVQE